MNVNWVKKITLSELAMVVGLGLLVSGLGIKMKGVKEVDQKMKSMEVNQREEALPEIVNINTAGMLELESLPAIGPATAKKIIEYRNSYGYFRDKSEIINVSGIGPKTYAKIKDKISI